MMGNLGLSGDSNPYCRHSKGKPGDPLRTSHTRWRIGSRPWMHHSTGSNPGIDPTAVGDQRAVAMCLWMRWRDFRGKMGEYLNLVECVAAETLAVESVGCRLEGSVLEVERKTHLPQDDGSFLDAVDGRNLNYFYRRRKQKCYYLT